ncbi:MAG: aldo/keto reductase [Microscillaceae bacterium]
MMRYRRLGKSGLQVSELSFGSWLTFGMQISNDTAQALMHRAYDAGINFFDNAEVYAEGRSEEVMGEILAKAQWPRDTFVVSSKVFWGGEKPNQKGLNRKHIIEACHAALRRLRVEYLDLFFCHRADLNTPMEETVRAMSDLIQQGKILYWGTSEWTAQEIMEAYAIARQYHLVPPTMEQPQYNMFHRERFEKEYHKLYPEIGIGTTIWSPLYSGLLTGKYNDGIPEGSRVDHHRDAGWLQERIAGEQAKPLLEKVKQLALLAQELGTTLPCLAIAWCLKNPNVSTVILGASKLHQLEENLGAIPLQDQLSKEIMDQIERILGNQPKIVRH